MYIDLIVLLILLILVIMYFNKFHSFILFIAIIDIALRILAYITDNLSLGKINRYINEYLPASMFDLIEKYTSDWGVVNLVLKWVYVGIMIIFLYYITKLFLKKKKI